MDRLFVRVLLREPPPARREHLLPRGAAVHLEPFPAQGPGSSGGVLPLHPEPATGLFTASTAGFPLHEGALLSVRLPTHNFSPATGGFVDAATVRPGDLPLLHPIRPLFREFLPGRGSGAGDSPEHPLVLTIPLRRLFVIGHRGSPYMFPENTIASFAQALNEGANGLEMDICPTRDDRLLVFHDPRPDAARLLFEDFPYELVSPVLSGRFGDIFRLEGGRYVRARRVPRWSSRSFDIARLKLNRVREYYRYRHVDGVEHPLPELEEVLEFAAARLPGPELLFLDVKNPLWRGPLRRRKFTAYGRLIARALRGALHLPRYVIVANEDDEVLDALRDGFRSEGEDRCLFSLDAAGGFLPMLGIKSDPVADARRLGTEVVSIGARFRAGDLEEIARAVRVRDEENGVSAVLHWTLNDEAGMRASLEAGVDGILTDRPAALVSILEEQGIALPVHARAPQAEQV